MVYKFRMISDESDEFFRDFEIKDSQTFFDLHNAIQNELDYDQSQMASFFLANEKWKKAQEFTLFDPTEEGEEKSSALVMDQAVLADYIKEKRQRLLYVFDMISDRSLFVELIETKKENPKLSYPFCSDANGDAPSQVSAEDSRDLENDQDEFDEYSGEEEFPEEDFDGEDFVDDDLGGDDDYFEDEGFQGGYDDYEYR
jgi:hypothetical protein